MALVSIVILIVLEQAVALQFCYSACFESTIYPETLFEVNRQQRRSPTFKQ